MNRDWAVPRHEALGFAPRRARYCVCVFAINEADRLLRQLTRMSAVDYSLDVVVADGGSTDGSTDPGVLAKLGVRALLVKRDVGRLGAQMRMAYAYALNEGYEGVVSIDGNDKDDPQALPLFAQALSEGVDHVQGSRYIPGGRGINTPLTRVWGVRLLHAPLISLAAGHRYTDTTNGFRAYSRRLLLDPRVAPFRTVFSGYELHYYLAIRAGRLGYRIREVPVTRAYPKEGKVPTKISPVRGNAGVLWALAGAVTGRFDPSPQPAQAQAGAQK